MGPTLRDKNLKKENLIDQNARHQNLRDVHTKKKIKGT